MDAEVDPAHAAGPEPAQQRDRSDPARVLVLQRLGATAREAGYGFPAQLCPRSPVAASARGAATALTGSYIFSTTPPKYDAVYGW
ncbi:hypothetical protein GCM10010308_35310 [Streptomyces vinaceusdrappus]|nr:hypothetical protein GCM10010308_35310 [Streptomyces vinaceusdrappus]